MVRAEGHSLVLLVQRLRGGCRPVSAASVLGVSLVGWGGLGQGVQMLVMGVESAA